jgi:hypothetical protein
MNTLRRFLMSATLLAVGVTVAQLSPRSASAAPWQDPITSVSRNVLSAEEGWISADGRFVLMSNRFDRRIRVLDRASGALTTPNFPAADSALMIPDGSGMVVGSDQDLTGDGRGTRPRLFRYLFATGERTVLSGAIDPNLGFQVGGISHDARYVVLTLAPGTDAFPNVHTSIGLLDTSTGVLRRVDTALGGLDRRSANPTISADGTKVAFTSHLGNCYPDCVDRTYVVDTATSSALTVDQPPGSASSNGNSAYPQISADGRHVLFFSNATNLTVGTPVSQWRLYLRDTDSTVVTLMPGSLDFSRWSASVSGDGQRIAYLATAPTDPNGTYDAPQVFVYDRSDSTRHQIVAGIGGALPNGYAHWAKISQDGRTVIFRSDAWNLVAGDDDFFLPRIYARGPAIALPPTPSPASSYAALTPSRLLDTRVGGRTVDGQFAGSGARTSGQVLELQVGGRASVPANAKAVVLNVTVTGPSTSGFITVWPCTTPSSPPPNASNLNFTAGQTIPNLVTVPLGSQGRVCLQVADASSHLLVDLNGYFPSDSTFAPVTPGRLLDTRQGGRTLDNQFAAIGLRSTGETLELQVGGRAAVPAGAAAVVLNMTVTSPSNAGFVTVWPCTSPASPPPNASNLNFSAGQTIANLVIVPLGSQGRVCVRSSEASTHLIADLNGYFPAGSPFVSSTPSRLLDTRSGGQTVDGQFSSTGARSAGQVLELQIGGRSGVPINASAVVMNVTVTAPTGAGFVTVWPCTVPASPPPNASNLNFTAGQTIPNLVLVPMDPGGKVCLQSSEASTHLLADLSGYFP